MCGTPESDRSNVAAMVAQRGRSYGGSSGARELSEDSESSLASNDAANLARSAEICWSAYCQWGGRVLPWIAGALPGFLILAWFKLRLAPPSQQPVAAMIAKVVDPLRHLAVIQSMPAAAGWWWTAPALVFLYLVIATWRSESTRAGIAMVVLMLVGYYVVYVTTPHPQSWHVETSFGWLLAQLWPTAVLAAVAGSEVQSGLAAPRRVSADSASIPSESCPSPR
jgi:hypothetical protein